MPLKITSWNIEHCDRLISAQPTRTVLDRQQRVRAALQDINPDIVCIQEGPRGERGIDAFCTQVLERQWVPVLLRQAGEALGERDREYQTKGTQWIWFLARTGLEGRCRLQAPAIWQAFTGGAVWPVNFWGEEAVTRHAHYRHPQVLLYDMGDGQTLELIGVHLKSKINQLPIEHGAGGELSGEYLREALQARVKLATEARNIRQYVAAKFDQLARPGIIVMGDCNDGPGQDLFETQYLFFDLISNIQGDVLVAERFFDHTLFDFPAHLRWTAKYPDAVLHIPASRNPLLLDHMLASQPLYRGELPLRAVARAGQVEHEAFERHNAGASSAARTSDHRPVSCVLEEI